MKYNKFNNVVTSIGLTIACLLVANSLLFFMFIKDIKDSSRVISSQALVSIESVFSYAKKANGLALEAYPISGSCDPNTLSHLRELVIKIPYVRSTNLATNGIIFCTSFFGMETFKDDRSLYIDDKLALFSGNEIDSKHPLLAFRSTKGEYIALSGIDGVYLKDILSKGMLSKNIRTYLNIGGKWLSELGQLETISPQKKLLLVDSFESKYYPMKIYTGLASNTLLSAFVSNSKFQIISLTSIIIVFSMYLTISYNKRPNTKKQLRDAIENGNIKGFAQGIYSLKQRKFVGMEILARWYDEGQIIGPNVFIPQVESFGLLPLMTDRLILNTVIELEKLHLKSDIYISFNISPAKIKVNELESTFEQVNLILGKKHNFHFILEITESHDADKSFILTINSFCEKFKNISLAIDDFGTGFANLSNLAELVNLKIKYLKVDRCFVQNLETCVVSQNIIRNIIDLTRRFSLVLIVEGVESEHQVKILENLGVDFIQGYYFSKPMPLQKFLPKLLINED
ncbi:EAL domain-containing protein [Vibrio sp. 10N.261.49.A12]|uniref:EAL domain-containing protein n=1 Tax=Vibrio sp. 10N.261.49.A12 TaxID=3229667 RepID=UPI0035501237